MQKFQGQDESGGDRDGDALEFPLEKTRLRGIYFLIAISSLGTLGYGLALMTRTVRLLSP